MNDRDARLKTLIEKSKRAYVLQEAIQHLAKAKKFEDINWEFRDEVLSFGVNALLTLKVDELEQILRETVPSTDDATPAEGEHND